MLNTESCPHCDGEGLITERNEAGIPEHIECEGCAGCGDVGACEGCAAETPATELEDNKSFCKGCYEQHLAEDPS